MFSITPRSRRFDFRAKSPARAATCWAASAGVVTTTTPRCGSRRDKVITMSPVPGGVSISRTSIADQSASSMNCATAFCTISPRHSSAWFSSASCPMDNRAIEPAPSARTSGSILALRTSISPCMPSRCVRENPQMSASRTPTRLPVRASATARLAVIEDLPTPPLPEAIMKTGA